MNYHEIKPESSRAYSKGCIGCQNAKLDIMLSFFTNEPEAFHDVFLTQEDAARIYIELGERIQQNEETKL